MPLFAVKSAAVTVTLPKMASVKITFALTNLAVKFWPCIVLITAFPFPTLMAAKTSGTFKFPATTL